MYISHLSPNPTEWSNTDTQTFRRLLFGKFCERTEWMIPEDDDITLCPESMLWKTEPPVEIHDGVTNSCAPIIITFPIMRNRFSCYKVLQNSLQRSKCETREFTLGFSTRNQTFFYPKESLNFLGENFQCNSTKDFTKWDGFWFSKKF